MVQITITIIGLQQMMNSLNGSANSLNTELKKSLDVIGDKGVKEFQNEAHVITGKMKRGVHKGKVTPNSLEILSQVNYAVYENGRGGSHAFIDKGAKKIEKIAVQEITNALKRVMTTTKR